MVSERVQQFKSENGIAKLFRGSEVFESAHRCESCGESRVGERFEVLGYNPQRGDVLTYFVCQPCVEAVWERN